MKVYKIILVLILVIAIGCGFWYYLSTRNEQRSDRDGLLVYEKYATEWSEAKVQGEGID